YRNGHELAIRRDIEQFLAILPPPGDAATRRRDLVLRPTGGDGLHVNLIAARLVPLVRHPASACTSTRTREEPGVPFVERRLQVRHRLVVPLERQQPEIVPRLWHELLVDGVSAVR